MNPATQKQLDLIADLAGRCDATPTQIGPVVTTADALKAIDYLNDAVYGGAPIRHTTRQRIFVLLREVGKTKDDMYLSLGIDSLADGTVTEREGLRCVRWCEALRDAGPDTGFETPVAAPAPVSTGRPRFDPRRAPSNVGTRARPAPASVDKRPAGDRYDMAYMTPAQRAEILKTVPWTTTDMSIRDIQINGYPGVGRWCRHHAAALVEFCEFAMANKETAPEAYRPWIERTAMLQAIPLTMCRMTHDEIRERGLPGLPDEGDHWGTYQDYLVAIQLYPPEIRVNRISSDARRVMAA